MTARQKRRLVRAENPDCTCGYVGHMTVDELKERAIGDKVDGTCPLCGQVHLTREEIEELERQKVTDSERFEKMKGEAEA